VSVESFNVHRIERLVLYALLALLVIACVLVLRPFLSAILWAATLTLATWPAHCRLRAWLGGRDALAAALTTLCIVLLLVAPLVFAGFAITDGAGPVVTQIREWIEGGLPPPPDWVRSLPVAGDWLARRWEWLSRDSGRVARELAPLAAPLRALGIAMAQGLAEGAFMLVMSTFVGYFLYRDGERIAVRLRRIAVRVVGPRADEILAVADGTIRGSVYGLLGTALAQAILAWIGLWIAGVPGAALLGFACFFLSVTPIGPPVVWGPAAFWLWQQGEPGWAIFMVLWGVLAVSGVDNVMKPLLISRGASLPFALVMIGVLGGALAFGFIGVFLGPTLLAVAYRLVDLWSTGSTEARDAADGASGTADASTPGPIAEAVTATTASAATAVATLPLATAVRTAGAPPDAANAQSAAS
jgi:predicted PurR-regulated permease PerM